jgi:NTE family protein
VLARMAEMRLLRRVEVISTVSGGSIVGALYYLHVKRLLESKPDAEIADADYVEIVRSIHRRVLRRDGAQPARAHVRRPAPK